MRDPLRQTTRIMPGRKNKLEACSECVRFPDIVNDTTQQNMQCVASAKRTLSKSKTKKGKVVSTEGNSDQVFLVLFMKSWESYIAP